MCSPLQLTDWVQDLNASSAWGDKSEVSQLLAMSTPEFRRLDSVVPPSERACILNRYDGMKSALHSAASSGSLETVQLLVSRGARIDMADLMGATPLHSAALLGDSHLEVLHSPTLLR